MKKKKEKLGKNMFIWLASKHWSGLHCVNFVLFAFFFIPTIPPHSTYVIDNCFQIMWQHLTFLLT